MKRIAMVLLWATSIFFYACIRPVIMVPTNEGTGYPATDPEKISISTMTVTDRPFKEVGYVFAQGKSIKEASKLAKEEAAKMGGTAIVDGRVHTQVLLTGFILFFPIYESFYYVRGTVARFE